MCFYLAELCGVSLAVDAGCSAQHTHGIDGRGDISLPLTGREPSGQHAVNVPMAAASNHAGEPDLITIKPLTDIALRCEPALGGQVAPRVIMGGTSEYVGNMTPVSEYNIWADTKATGVVFASGMMITLVGWDSSRKYAEIDDALPVDLRGIGTRKAELAVDFWATLRRF